MGLVEEPTEPKKETPKETEETFEQNLKNPKAKEPKTKQKQREPSAEKEGEISVQSRKTASADWLKTKGQLSVDVYQTDDGFCVQSPIAGVEASNISIVVENEMLVIKGERQEPEPDKDKEFFYQECYWGPFSRQIILPEDVDVQNIKAGLKKGVLSVKIPRIKLANKQIKVEVEE